MASEYLIAGRREYRLCRVYGRNRRFDRYSGHYQLDVYAWGKRASYGPRRGAWGGYRRWWEWWGHEHNKFWIRLLSHRNAVQRKRSTGGQPSPAHRYVY